MDNERANLIFNLLSTEKLLTGYIVAAIILFFILSRIFHLAIFPSIAKKISHNSFRAFKFVAMILLISTLMLSLNSFKNTYGFASNGLEALIFYTEDADKKSHWVDDETGKRLFKFSPTDYGRIGDGGSFDDNSLKFVGNEECIMNGYLDEDIYNAAMTNLKNLKIKKIPDTPLENQKQ